MKLLKRIALAIGALLLLQLLVRVYLYFRPEITPTMVQPLLESGWRRRYRDPRRTLAPLRLTAGETVIEVGGGTGVFTREAARQVVPHGRVVTIDLQRAMLRRLARRVWSEDRSGIDIGQADAQRLPFVSRSADALIMIAVLPMIPDRVGALCEARRVLRPGGRLLVSEEIIAPEYVPPPITLRWARAAGFTPTQIELGFWSYTVVLQPDDSYRR